MSFRNAALPLTAVFLLLGGCGQPEAPSSPVVQAVKPKAAHTMRSNQPGMTQQPGRSQAQEPAGSGNAASQPAPVAPVAPAAGSGSTKRPASQPLPPGPVEVAGLHFEMPKEWTRLTPSSQMRAAQASIKGPAGPGELTMFFFGVGGGGGVEANLQRWIGQMTQAPGSEAKRESFQVGDIKGSLVDVAGTRMASGFGMGPAKALENQRMVAAVLEGPGGPWFFKLMGPDGTIAPARAGFLEMLKKASTAKK